MESTEVFASGASCVNDEAAPAGPVVAIGRIWVVLGGVAILTGLASLAAATTIEIYMSDPKFAEGIATYPIYPYVGWILVHARLLASVQLGMAAGAYFSGLVFDMAGSYYPAFVVATGIATFATISMSRIKETSISARS